MSLSRPSSAELVAARAFIARAKQVDPSIRNADELLVCAAFALHAGEFDGVATRAAMAMGKVITKPKLVTNWLARIKALGHAPDKATLLVQPEWIKQHTPGIQQLEVEQLVESPGKQHGKRKISAVSSTPNGSIQRTTASVDYTFPPAEGESESAAKQRADRHRRREERKLRALDMSGVAREHATTEAWRHRQAREDAREVAAALDACIENICQQDAANRPLQLPPRGDRCWHGVDHLGNTTAIPRFVDEAVWLVSDDVDKMPLPVDLLDARMIDDAAEEGAHNARVEAGTGMPVRGHWQKNGHGSGKTFVNYSGERHLYRSAGYVLAASGALSAPPAQVARIDQIWANDSADVTLLDMESMEFGAERVERVPYGQLRQLYICPRISSQQLHVPDLTREARDAAVAELRRHHAMQEAAEQQDTAVPIELQCTCTEEHFEAEKKNAALCKMRERRHPSIRCPVGEFERQRRERHQTAWQAREKERRRLVDCCRALKGHDTCMRNQTVHSLADMLEAFLCDAAVISYIRSFEKAGIWQQLFREKCLQLEARVQCDRTYLQKQTCFFCRAPPSAERRCGRPLPLPKS
jgi:hypothetical protein